MQLILNTDTNIGIQKMTTIKQDPIEGKFNSSLVDKVSNEITTRSNECIKNELIVQVYESITSDENIPQNINSEAVLDKTNDGNHKQYDEECDKGQEINNENSQLENEQNEIFEENAAIEDKQGMQYDDNNDLRSISVSLGEQHVQPIGIEMSETTSIQQDIMQTEIKDKIDEANKRETEVEEKSENNFEVYTKIKHDKQNKKDTEIEMEVKEQYAVQDELEDKIGKLDKVATEIEDKIEKQNRANSKREDKIDGQNQMKTNIENKIGGKNGMDTITEDKIQDTNGVNSKMENKIEEHNEVNSNADEKISDNNLIDTEIQVLNTLQDNIAIEIREHFEGKDTKDIEIVKNNEEQRKQTINISDVDDFRDNDKMEDNIKKQDNVETDVSVQDDPSSVKDCTEEELDKKIDEIQDQSMNDKVVDKVPTEEGKRKKNMLIEDKDNLKSKVNNDVGRNNTKQPENYDEIEENIKGQELLKESVNCETNVITEQLNQIQTNTDCDFNKIPPSNSELQIEIKNNNFNYENMEVDLEQSRDLQNTDSEKGDKISLNSKCKATEPETGEVINIADEKDEDLECIIDQDIHSENKVGHTFNKETATIDKNLGSVLGTDIKEIESTAKISELKSIVPVKFPHEDKELDLESLHKAMEKSPVIEKIVEEKKELTHICKLSNTLDILSDDEDSSNEDSQKDVTDTAEKQCINIEDDDDIMLIDEESNSKDSINKVETVTEPTNDLENEQCNVNPKDKREYSFNIFINEDEAVEQTVEKQSVNETFTTEVEDDKGAQEVKQAQQKPLLPVNFLKTCKKNLADMTRDELEEFCILKIVESVVDRSNLSEIKSQLKSLAQNIEEYRKKASTLTKQNRDLQVVLKSVQEEQKKRSNLPITPLKITRSVGMQVLMTDKIGGMRKKTSHGPNTLQNNTNSAPNRSGKGQGNQNSKYQKIQTSTSPIPVPRLVPAANTSHVTNMKVQPPNVNAQGKSNSATGVQIQPLPNGIPLSPTPKPEKRSHGQMQQNNSVTVDLTDDEPPAKVIQRNIAPPVRLVPPQNLLAAHRQPFGANINSPRKVYIPISGSQNHTVGVRPGQTIMLKTISPQGPRQRCPTPAGKINQNVNTVRMQRLPNRHPAPLPDSMKQYQPPNWKTLPPAPELNLSKVDNGIVISWKIEEYHEDEYEEIASYQLYAYQETSSPPSTALWKKIGDVKALPLPMACTLTQFMPGYKYYFAVRAVDIRSRLGPFSLPGSILLLNKI